MTRKLKKGITTGSCAAAAVAAAMEAVFGNPPDIVDIRLPDAVTLLQVPIESVACRFDGKQPDGETLFPVMIATVKKDAGDDPDVTHGALVGATVRVVRTRFERILIKGGEGVGIVTRAGLPVGKGEPAINPVPRQMIRDEIKRRLPHQMTCAVVATIFVKGGAEIAKHTLNPRLGVVGGISILGTTGIVKPFSAKSYKDTIDICLNSARMHNHATCVLTTGRRSERLAQALYPDLAEACFVQIADFVNHALKQAVKSGFTEIIMSCFLGKLCKWAMGMPYTHAWSGLTDFEFLANLMPKGAASGEFTKMVASARTAREIFESSMPEVPAFVDCVAEKALAQIKRLAGPGIRISICLWDFKENLYGTWHGTE